jgi:hypothetical protein
LNLKAFLDESIDRYCTINYRYATIEIEFIPKKFSGDEHQAREYALKWGRDLHKLVSVEDDFITISLLGPSGPIENVFFPLKALTFKIPHY